MATLNQHYSSKKTNTTVRKTFMVPLNELYVEPGFNIRDIDPEHVEEFHQAYAAGEYVPALAVEVTSQGVKIIDGHHRYHGALLAQADGHDIRLECKDFTGNEADKVAFMVTSSQGRALSPMERAEAYRRMRNQGLTNEEIARKVKRSASDVLNHLQLIDCEQPIKDMVKKGDMSYTTAIALQKEHGANAGAVAEELKEKAVAQGKKKVSAAPKFNAKSGRMLAETMCRADREGDTFVMTTEDANLVSEIINDYLSGK